MSLQFTALRYVLLACALSWLFIFPVNSALATEIPFPEPTPTPYSLKPDTLHRGQSYDLYLKSDPAADLSNLEVEASAGSGVEVSKSKPELLDANQTARIQVQVKPDAAIGDTRLIINKGGQKSSVILHITGLQPLPQQPTPGEPQVDMMWEVLSTNVTKDNFGHYIAKRYYCIEVTIGNNSGFDIQVATVGFTIPERKQDSPTPAISYRTGRGTLERGQKIGWRNTTVNVIKGLGPFLTGFTPFFKAVGPRASFTEFINIFSNPFEKGFELVAPDVTLSQLARLDDQLLRDGLIIPNNSIPRITHVLIQKDSLRRLIDKDKRDDPQEIKRILGTLVLIGYPVQYLQRVSILSNPQNAGVQAPPTLIGVNITTLKQGDPADLVISGTNLANASISVPSGVSGFSFTDVKPDANGKLVTAKVKVADDVLPAEYSFFLATPNGQQAFTIKVEHKAAPSELKIQYVDESKSPSESDTPPTLPKIGDASDTDQSFDIVITGKYLAGARLNSKDSRILISNVDNQKDEKITAHVIVKAGTPAPAADGGYEIEVENEVKESGKNTVKLKFTRKS